MTEKDPPQKTDDSTDRPSEPENLRIERPVVVDDPARPANSTTEPPASPTEKKASSWK